MADRINASYDGPSNESYLDYMRSRAMTLDTKDAIAENAGMQTAALVAANRASTAVASRGIAGLQGSVNAGFSGLSGQVDDLNFVCERCRWPPR